jgi:hypothetical protein
MASFQHGHKKVGGRKKGSVNKATAHRQQAMDQAYQRLGITPERLAEITPLQGILMVMHWGLDQKDPNLVLAAATAAAPFVHPKLSSSDVRITTELRHKSEAELAAEVAELERRIAQTRAVLPSTPSPPPVIEGEAIGQAEPDPDERVTYAYPDGRLADKGSDR